HEDNHVTRRHAPAGGDEKKNGGSTATPPIGTLVSTCQSATAATATMSWSASRVGRDMGRRLSLRRHARTCSGHPRLSPSLPSPARGGGVGRGRGRAGPDPPPPRTARRPASRTTRRHPPGPPRPPPPPLRRPL